MRKISVSVDSVGRVTADSELLGYSGEHNAVVLAVDFSSGRNEGFMSAEYCRVVIEGLYSDEIYVTDGGFEYTVPGECMLPPKVNCQIVGYKTDNGEPTVIVKTEVFGFSVERSEIPIEAVGGDAGVFERTLEKCSALTKTAVASADSAKASCEEASASAQTATEAMRSSVNSAAVAKKSAETAVSAAEVLSATAINMKDVSNALKGSASGKVVAIKDVSPLPHDVTVKVSGGDTEGGEVLTKTETLSTKDAAVLLDNPASSVRVVVSGGAYCVGGLVPTVSSDDLTVSGVREQLALWPTWSYGEAPGVYDLEYTISGDTLSWSGVKYYASDSSMNEAVSGSVELSTTGQMITGFCQVYDLSEDNPYAESPEYDQLDMTVEVYEGTSSVQLTVLGKNLIPYPYAEYFERRGITFTPNADGTVTVNGQNDGTGTARLTFTHTNWDLPLGKYMMHSGHNVCIASAQILRANGSYNYTSNNSFTLNEGDKITGMWVQVLAADSDVVFDNVIVKPQLECGTVATEFESYREPVTYTPKSDGEISIASVYPSMTFIPDTEGVALSVEYNRDINKAFAELQAALISMGGNV